MKELTQPIDIWDFQEHLYSRYVDMLYNICITIGREDVESCREGERK